MILNSWFFFFKQKTAYEIGLGIPAEPLFRSRLMLVMVVFFIAFRWIRLSTPLIRLFLLVLILLLMPTLNFLPVWFALSLLRFRLPSRLPMMFILWMVAMMVVIIPSRTRSEERFSRNAETDLVCRLLLEKKKKNKTRTTCDAGCYISLMHTLS